MTDETKIIAYRIKHSECRGWMYAGTLPDEIGNALACVLAGDVDYALPADERGDYIVEPYETTQAEIDSLPEFEGFD